jgi:hypothetical protein
MIGFLLLDPVVLLCLRIEVIHPVQLNGCLDSFVLPVLGNSQIDWKFPCPVRPVFDFKSESCHNS